MAYAFANINPTVTVNGVTFSNTDNGTQGLTITGPYAEFRGFTSPNPPFSSLSTSYQSLLGSGIYGSGNGSFTINGLTPGDRYEAQFFVNEPRGGIVVDRAETLTGGATLFFNSTGTDGGVGQFADSSVFTADASSTATFAVTPNFRTVDQVNAFQVRDLGSSPVPEASTTVSLGAMLGLGGLALGIRARRRRTAAEVTRG